MTNELITRLETAKAGSQELDRGVWVSVFPEAIPSEFDAMADCGLRPLGLSLNFTTSVDAALALIEERLPRWQQLFLSLKWTGNKRPGNGEEWSVTLRECSDPSHSYEAKAAAKTPALALCAALLRALEVKS